jgi:tetratricopeptide (TPR) repeat protein
VPRAISRSQRRAWAVVIGLCCVLASCLLPSRVNAGEKSDHWIEVRSPHFTVVSNASEQKAREVASRFEQIRTVFSESLPLTGSHPSPSITILAFKNQDSLRPLLAEFWTGGHARPGGFFTHRLGQFYMALDLSAPGPYPYATLYHEYYHSLTTPYIPTLPVWLAEGLAEFFGNTEISAGEVRMGLPDPSFIKRLKQDGLMRITDLINVDRLSPYYNEQAKTSIFYAEAWALTHYLMVGDHNAHRAQLMQFLEATAQGVPAERAAVAAFGDLKQLEQTLIRYLGSYIFYHLTTAAPAPLPAAAFPARALSQAEVDSYQGGFLVTRGRLREAQPILAEAASLDPNLASTHSHLALADYLLGATDQADAEVSRAIALDPQDWLASYLRAYFAFPGSMVNQDDEMEADLRNCIRVQPEFAPALGMLAAYLAAQNRDLPRALEFAQKAVALEPANSGYQLARAKVLGRMQRYEAASESASLALATAQDDQSRVDAEAFVKFLEPYREHASEHANSKSLADSVAPAKAVALHGSN